MGKISINYGPVFKIRMFEDNHKTIVMESIQDELKDKADYFEMEGIENNEIFKENNEKTYARNQNYIDNEDIVEFSELDKSLFEPFIIENLKNSGLKSLFPVQCDVIPSVLRGVILGGDICVSAPTGSGKTLTYVIPIVQTLFKRKIVKVRALVIVPTHDLVLQVLDVFKKMTFGTDLIIQPLYGENSFKNEKKNLLPSNPKIKMSGGLSLVDIVITTPGRLVEHLQETSNFTLQHLQFLVIDEADRLMMQSYNDWLPKVLHSIYKDEEKIKIENDAENFKQPDFTFTGLIYSKTLNTTTMRNSYLNISNFEKRNTQVQKLLFSATLTQNPEKLAGLGLVNPQFFNSTAVPKGFLYSIPQTVQQHFMVIDYEQKPLCFLYIIKETKQSQILCFTKSVESAHRLYLLIKLMDDSNDSDSRTQEYSSDLTQSKREITLKIFKENPNGVLICSDVMSRGLDIENVGIVVNYDTPHHIKSYIHRVGRTGRAGRNGKSITFCNPREVYFFKKTLEKTENAYQINDNIPLDFINKNEKKYQIALSQLQTQIKNEQGLSSVITPYDESFPFVPLDSKNPVDTQIIISSIKEQLMNQWFPELINPTELVIENKKEQVPVKKIKKKRNRRHRKGNLDSISFSSSDSDSASESKKIG